MAEITYLCKRTIVSTKPVQPGKTHSLSTLERLMEPNDHLEVVLYYKTDRASKPGAMIKSLRETLSETLTVFPAVTGRLVVKESEADGGNTWMVKCNDAGVRMVEARAKGSVEEWLQSVDSEKEKKYMIHWEEMYYKPYFWSTFYVQITEFEEGGLAVGLSCTQLLVDPVSATNFLKAWADISIRGKMINPPIFHRLSARRSGDGDPNRNPELITHYKALVCDPSTASRTNRDDSNIKFTTISLAFSDQMVRSCMSMAQAQDDIGPGPSPFEALAGLIWASVSRVRGQSQGLVGLSMGLDMRKELSLDEGYFGNCMVYTNVQARPEENNPLAATNAIRGEMAKINREGVVDLMERLEKIDEIDPKKQILDGFRDLLCLNLESIDPYQTIFEDGSEGPIRGSYYIESPCEKGWFLILPSRPVNGQFSRVVMATLPEDEALKLCEDELLSSFSPTILMGAKRDNVH